MYLPTYQFTFIYLKAPMVNPMPYRSLVFPEYGMTNASTFKCEFTDNLLYFTLDELICHRRRVDMIGNRT